MVVNALSCSARRNNRMLTFRTYSLLLTTFSFLSPPVLCRKRELSGLAALRARLCPFPPQETHFDPGRQNSRNPLLPQP